VDALLASHPHARAVLRAGLPPGGSPSHAYLFHGPAGAGKRATARAFAGALLADGAPDPAGAARRAGLGVHPDLTWVAPTGAAEMLVADVEEPVVAAVNHTPFEASRRVFVIERAETMNDATGNRLLKTLEEPPAFAHLILISDRPGDLLPTIVSRCQPVRFEAPSHDALAARLDRHGIPPQTAHATARLALGDGGRALALALGEGPALRAAAEAYARAALHGTTATRPWASLLKTAGAAGDAAAAQTEEALAARLELLPAKEQARARRESAEQARRVQRRARTEALDSALQLAGLWLRDVACVVDGAPELVHATDRADALAQDAAAFASAHALRDAVAFVDETRTALRLVNATEELALEALAYRIERRARAAAAA
jgi:DNA polymerase-3 subunit delta'